LSKINVAVLMNSGQIFVEDFCEPSSVTFWC